MPKPVPIVVDGVRYNTIRDAWRAVAVGNLPEITVRKRLKAGWTPEDAFLTPVIPPRQRRGFKVLRVN